MQTRLLLTFLLIISLPSLAENDTYPKVDEIWELITKSNKASISSSEVLYYMPSDAFNTYQARAFNDWDTFSVVDSRNLVRLSTGNKVKILDYKNNKKILKVRLLDGPDKDRNYYIITKDLIKNFSNMEKS